MLTFFIGVTWNVLFVNGLPKSQATSCYEHFDQIDIWYKFHRMPATFHNAALRCSLEGGVIASPITKKQEVAMKTIMKCYGLENPMYTGIHATFSTGDFVSMEGVPICKLTTAWAPKEPDNKGGQENCIVMTPEGTLADENCNSTFSYLCAKKTNQSYSCGANTHGYEYSERTGSCYKFHKKATDWRHAYMSCQADGGHLAIINNSTEAEVLRELYAKYPEHTIEKSGDYFSGSAMVGFHDQFKNGRFMTIHGQTLNEAGFAKFSFGQPDNQAPGEHCGAIFRNGQLNDFWCYKTAPFICEITPGSLSSGLCY